MRSKLCTQSSIQIYFPARWGAVRTKLMPSGKQALQAFYICECIASISPKASHLKLETMGITDLRKVAMVKRNGGNAVSLTLSAIP